MIHALTMRVLGWYNRVGDDSRTFAGSIALSCIDGDGSRGVASPSMPQSQTIATVFMRARKTFRKGFFRSRLR
jgi:hypothetical protein